MNFGTCQILTVLSLAIFCQTNASNVFMQCSEGKDKGNSCGNLPKGCPNVDEDTKKTCAVTCGLCPKPPTFPHTPVVLKKIQGPDKKRNGKTQAAIWLITWKKGSEDEAYFYPAENVEEGSLYEGFIESDPLTKITALGDVTDEKAKIAFYFTTEKTDVAIAEVNADSGKYPLNSNTLVNMGNGIASGNSGQSRKLEARLSGRQANNPAGYKGIIQPIYDLSVQNSLGNNAARDVKAAFMMAAESFLHKSNPVPFKFHINDPVYHPKKVVASQAGFVDILTTQRFDFASLPKNVTLVIFVTKTPPAQITDPFNLEYGPYAQVCNPSLLTRVGIMEMFGPPLTVAKTAVRVVGRVVGYGYDFLKNGNNLGPRTSGSGANCYQVGGFMDVTAGAKEWSECSKEDIRGQQKNGHLKCLDPFTCSGKDMSTLCPAMVAKFTGACDKDYIKKTCKLSCGPKYCSASVLTNATLPDKGCLPTSCKPEMAYPTTVGVRATADVLAGGDTTMAMGAGKTCPPCQNQFRINGTGDCLLACPQIKRNIGCDQSDVKECCKSSCYIPTQKPSGYNPNANNNGNVGDKLGSQYCQANSDLCGLKKFKDDWCVATCANVNANG